MSVLSNASHDPPRRWAQLVDELRLDSIHGASWLARRAAGILAECADEESARISAQRNLLTDTTTASESNGLADLSALAWAMVWARPSMTAIANTVADIWRKSQIIAKGNAESGEIVEALGRLSAEATRQRERWADVVAELSRRIRPLLNEPVFTLSRSGSVEYALIAAARDQASMAPLDVIIAESRPGGEGIALAQSLAAARARVTIVTDSAVGAGMARARTLLLGADSVRSDGALVNKVGSYPAALVATDLGIPVYALCELLKITPPSYPLTLERTLGSDRDEWREGDWLFDVTPGRLITAIVTEEGALSQDEIARSAADAEVALELLKEFAEQARVQGPGPDHQS